MSTAFSPLGMNSYNNTLPQGGYQSWKGIGIFSNPTGLTPGNIRPLTNNDITNNAPQNFGLPRPIKHFRKGIIQNTDNSYVNSSTGNNLIKQMIDIPGGYLLNTSPNSVCDNWNGIGIVDDWKPITNLTENPQPISQTKLFCCNQEKNALRRVRPSSTKLKKNYYTTTEQYLYNRCQTFEQKQFNYLSYGNNTIKPGSPLSLNNVYKSNCNPNLEIEYTESRLPEYTITPLTPSNPRGCEKVQYNPNNFKFAQQGAVSSSDRLLRLNIDTINLNKSNIEKTTSNLLKSKYFNGSSGNINTKSCLNL